MALPGERKTPLLRSFGCAWAGIAVTARGRNFKIQSAFALLAMFLSAGFTAFGIGAGQDSYALSVAEWGVVLACIGVVLGGECVNTALEAAVDLASPEYHELAKRAKDCAAGGVLVASIFSFAIGVMLFLPRLLQLASALATGGLS